MSYSCPTSAAPQYVFWPLHTSLTSSSSYLNYPRVFFSYTKSSSSNSSCCCKCPDTPSKPPGNTDPNPSDPTSDFLKLICYDHQVYKNVLKNPPNLDVLCKIPTPTSSSKYHPAFLNALNTLRNSCGKLSTFDTSGNFTQDIEAYLKNLDQLLQSLLSSSSLSDELKDNPTLYQMLIYVALSVPVLLGAEIAPLIRTIDQQGDLWAQIEQLVATGVPKSDCNQVNSDMNQLCNAIINRNQSVLDQYSSADLFLLMVKYFILAKEKICDNPYPPSVSCGYQGPCAKGVPFRP